MNGNGQLQRVGLADDRSELASLDEPGASLQVGAVLPGDEHGEPLAGER
jgi:hypothetical protein